MSRKLEELSSLLKGFGRVLIAYSGGVDSSFLLKVARDALGDNARAVIAESPTFPADEVRFAKETCKRIGAAYRVIQTDEFSDENFLSNPPERCYYCKRELFSRLLAIARNSGVTHVLDGSNHDDRSDLRPGSRAKEELGVKSPLMDLGFTKVEIRRHSREMGLPTWDKPSYACLASRVPYGTRITSEILARIEAGEKFLRSLGFKQLRVRHHGSIVRIEVDRRSTVEVLDDDVMKMISDRFEELGYTYVTLDLKGYRTGSMNEATSRSSG